MDAAAQLSIRGGVEVVIRRVDGEARAGTPGGHAHPGRRRTPVSRSVRSRSGKMVRQRPGVVPDVGARAVAAAGYFQQPSQHQSLPSVLALHGGRLEDREVGRDGLDDLGGEGRVEGPGEALHSRLESVILRAPVAVIASISAKTPAYQGVCSPARAGATARRLVGVLSQAQVGHGRARARQSAAG